MTFRRALFLGNPALLAFLMGASAEAAMLDGVQGTVLVDKGGGYTTAHGPMQLNPGDSAIANPGGTCAVPVQPGSVVAVAGQSPCSIETGAVDPPPAPSGGFFNTGTLIVGGVIVGGVVAAVVLLNDNNKPASP